MEHVTKAQVKFVRSLQLKKNRDESGLFVAEGEKCVEELRKGFQLELLVVSSEKLVVSTEYRVVSGEKVVVATREEIERMSGLETPQGVVGVFKKQDGKPTGRPEAYRREDASLQDLVVALDGVQNPGNLGTIIRTCDWFGVKRIVCSPDTADCYNPKVVQATMGALTRVRVEYMELPKWLETYQGKVYGTLLDGKNLYERLKDGKPTGRPEAYGREDASLQDGQRPTGVIVFGNEGKGISEEVRKYISEPIRIPSYPEGAETSESLNVAIAAAIVLAEFRRA